MARDRHTPLTLAALVLAVTLVWCWFYDLHRPGQLATPLYYAGDALYFLGVAQAFAEFPSLLDLAIFRLNAPAGAHWNDFPPTHKPLFYFMGLLTRLAGPAVAFNLSLLLAHLLAAVAFYATCRYFAVRRPAAVAFSLFYAFCWYLLYRSMFHLNLCYIWHLPLWLIVVDLCFAPPAVPAARKWTWGLLITLVTAVQDAYYFYIYLLLLMMIGLILLIRRRPDLYVTTLVGVLLAAFVLHYLHFFLAVLRAGPNYHILERRLIELYIYSLNLADLVWPVNLQLPWASRFARDHYYRFLTPMADVSAAFLGGVGLIALLALALYAFYRAARAQWEQVPPEAWIALLTFLLAVTGGLNFFLGTLGFLLFRSANRFSIVILTLSLVFLARLLFTRLTPVRYIVLSFLVMIFLGETWFHRLYFREAQEMSTQAPARLIDHDRAFAAALENSLPPSAPVFQLPVTPFPEARDEIRMGNYDHFRPYLWTATLRFSFGDHKGRDSSVWQGYLAKLPLPLLLLELEEQGFHALYINRWGFPDHARGLEAELRALGKPVIAASGRGDLVAYRLHPPTRP